MPVKTTPEESSPYSVNKALFEEAASIKEKVKMVENRLEKMDQHRADVSEAVYFKVKTDYETQLDEVRGSFNEKSKEIERELAQLYQARKEQEELLGGHQEVLEEAKFRHTLGEFNDKKFKDLEGSQNKEIKKYGDLLAIIQASIKQYEEILGYSYQQHFRVETPAAPKVAPAAAPVAPLEKKAQPAKASPPPRLEEDTSRNLAPAVAVEPSLTSKHAIGEEAGAGAGEGRGYEEKLSEDLDIFLESEGDYFTSEGAIAGNEDSIVPPPSEGPKKTAAPAAAPAASKGLDDSLSAILKDIPLEEEQSDTVARHPGDDTGAKIESGSMPPEASLILLEGDLEENEFILGENTSIGRSPSNDVVLKETKVSRQHAAINFRDGYYVMVDLKSSNGVFVNGKRIDEITLKDGDEVEVGSFKFQFNLS